MTRQILIHVKWLENRIPYFDVFYARSPIAGLIPGKMSNML